MQKLFINIFFCSTVISLVACTSLNRTTTKCYKNKRTIVSGYEMGKMIDTYLKLKKGNYFQYSRKVMGLTKIEEYNGSYTIMNDTITLKFCNNSKPDELTGKGMFDKSGKSISLFTNTINDRHFIIRKDKR
jgi:hypothetical protein